MKQAIILIYIFGQLRLLLRHFNYETKALISRVYLSDVDECAASGGLYGNHCYGNTKCVNSIGSYACECLHGYELIDPFMCQDVDECQRDSSVICDRNAICFNLPGTYRCQCQKGYHGNGTFCARKYVPHDIIG